MNFFKEEESDRLKDRRMERGGVGGNQRYDKAPGKPNTFGKKPGKKYDGMSALEKVKADIRAKHGHGAIKEDAKMGKQSDEKLAALHKQVSGADQSLPSNQFMLKRVTKEMNRRKKATKTEGYAPGDVDQKVGAVTPIPKKDQDDARARILAKAKAKRAARLKSEGVIVEKKKDCVKKEKKTVHNCAKKVCSEQWGVGECIYGEHAIPDAAGHVAWYDVLFEHGIEKGVDVTSLEVLEEGVHGEHVEYAVEGKKGLWANIHAKRKRGEKPAKKGDKDYPDTLKVERADMWHPDPEKDKKLGGPGANARAREDRAAASKPKADPKKLKDGESYMDYSKRQKSSKQKYSPEFQKRLDAAKAKKKEGIVGKVARKLGLKKEGMSYNEFCIEAHTDG